MRIGEVPDELLEIARREWCMNAPARGGAWNIEGGLRELLAAVIPETEKRAREQVADAIEARAAEYAARAKRLSQGDDTERVMALDWAAQARNLGEGAEIARGEVR
ncbi:hypothetical protein [Actinomadura yumaensis]|uniref:Uncharacterized protein n=1 Tax=Actinomadura yumaensis TaxID=111807 RepID=A0ABW2CPR9_9ACTN